jgi:hypothetical protein
MGHVEGVGEISDLEMMKNPDLWPMIVVLPMKGKNWKIGLLMANEDATEYLWLEGQNMYGRLDPNKGERMKPEELQRLVDEGWRVD